MKILSSNKRVLVDYEILDKYEAGMVLTGWEVKSIKDTNLNLSSAFIFIRGYDMYISAMRVGLLGSSFIKDKNLETRERRLLMHKNEIMHIKSKIKSKGLTIVPVDIYVTEKGLIKLQIAVVRGKKKYEKKLSVREKDLKREIDIDRKTFGI